MTITLKSRLDQKSLTISSPSFKVSSLCLFLYFYISRDLKRQGLTSRKTILFKIALKRRNTKVKGRQDPRRRCTERSADLLLSGAIRHFVRSVLTPLLRAPITRGIMHKTNMYLPATDTKLFWVCTQRKHLVFVFLSVTSRTFWSVVAEELTGTAASGWCYSFPSVSE